MAAGEPIGRVGESGDAAFPHLHLNVFENGVRVDPFAYGAPPGACGGVGMSLWTPAAARALAYRSPDLINAGFADGSVTLDDVEEGRADARTPTAASPAVVVFVRAIGLRQGDVLSLQLAGPGGLRADGAPTILDGNKAQWMMFVGARRPATGWPRGLYRGHLVIRRSGATALDRTFDLTL